MATWKYSEIKRIMEYTPLELKGRQISEFEHVGCGCYTPGNANWSYCVNVINHNNRLHQVVATFGIIK